MPRKRRGHFEDGGIVELNFLAQAAGRGGEGEGREDQHHALAHEVGDHDIGAQQGFAGDNERHGQDHAGQPEQVDLAVQAERREVPFLDTHDRGVFLGEREESVPDVIDEQQGADGEGPGSSFWSGKPLGAVIFEALDSRVRKPVSSPIALINGAGKTMVVFFSTPSSSRVCRFRSCKASGCFIMVSDASPSAAATRASPSAAMILARFSRSASAWRAIARFMLSGSWMSLSPTNVTCTPHSTVVASRIWRILPLIF